MSLWKRSALVLIMLCSSAAATARIPTNLLPDELAIHNAETAGHGTRLAMNRYWYANQKWAASPDELDYTLEPGNTTKVSVDENTGVVTLTTTAPAELAGMGLTFTPEHQPDHGITWTCASFGLPDFMRPC